MFRSHQLLFQRIQMGLDAAVVLVCLWIAWGIKFQSGLLRYTAHLPFHTYAATMLVSIPVFLVTNTTFGLYRSGRARNVLSEVVRVLQSCLVGLLILVTGLYFFKMVDFSRDVLLLFAVAYTVVLTVERTLIRVFAQILRRRGYNQKYMVIVGWNHAAEKFVTNVAQSWLGYKVFGYIANDAAQEPRCDIPCMGHIDDLDNLLRQYLIDQVIVALPRTDIPGISTSLHVCERLGIRSLLLPDYFDLLPARPRFESLGDMALIDTRYIPLDDALNAALKRAFDIAFSISALIFLLPVMALISLSIKCSSSGTVFFVQDRVGKNRRTFKMYKFRTMHVSSDNETGWTTAGDARRTAIGAFLRKTSLDELPQFWNVLIGDMSVIGPRPERPFYVERFMEEIPRYMTKHRVRPGMTGWAQVNGWRGDTSISERIRFDIDYIENWSLWLDIKIVLRTIRDGFVHPNAY